MSAQCVRSSVILSSFLPNFACIPITSGARTNVSTLGMPLVALTRPGAGTTSIPILEKTPVHVKDANMANRSNNLLQHDAYF